MAKISIQVEQTRLDVQGFVHHLAAFHRFHRLRLTQIRALHNQPVRELVFAVVSQIIRRL